MVGKIDIKALTLDELSGIVNLYPWFGGARAELCRRMASLGDNVWGDEEYGAAALYFPERRIAYALARSGRKMGYSDSRVGELLKRYFEPQKETAQAEGYRGVGDYFSLESYRQVRRGEDSVFSTFAKNGSGAEYVPEEEFTDFCTETLAEVYLEQGYPDNAREIYSKLSLRYPEKSAYFAGLIEKIEKSI